MTTLLSDFRSALAFITVLPAGKNVAWSPLGMIRFFPVVGLILGGIVYLFDLLVSPLWPPLVVALLDTVLLVCLTGGFHLDGLGDAADGLFSHRPRERALEIMKDSRIGMMALVAVVSVLAVKTAGIYSVKVSAPSVLVFLAVPSLARGGMLFGIRFLNYGRKNSGTGLDLFEKSLGLRDFAFLLIPVAISLFLGYNGLVLIGTFAAASAGILIFYKIKMDCITGDMLGAMTELLEAVLFLAAGILVV